VKQQLVKGKVAVDGYRIDAARRIKKSQIITVTKKV
jgi:hypothetical protein